MATIGYARVSTIDQDLTIQLEKLQNAGCERTFREKKSGTSRESRVELESCLEFLCKGDTLVITKIDRLARSTRDFLNIMHQLDQKGVSLEVLDDPVDVKSELGKAILPILAIFAEIETKNRKQRQTAGIEKAKAKGVYKGRKPTAMSQQADAKKLLDAGLSKSKIAKMLNVSEASIYRMLPAQEKSQKAA
ncbi:MAG: recombinase family protein [Candidatus Thiothrix putei]|uniref:Recombinase family protein n=1 Tax=Candidatus Thiothrix putei TaxID=3080811 RepID=A0AA95KMB4_9GAMM|nr:MAG: recombinase family protein [Candidatus Thiothrix putei]